MSKLILALGGLSLGGLFLIFKDNRSARDKVVDAAQKELDLNDATKYWKNVMPKALYYPAEWCGAFALWSLHQAGLAKNWDWEDGKGFLYKLPQTKEPKPGDVAYFNNFQHQAVIKGVRPDGSIDLINGNSFNYSTMKKGVASSNVPKSAVTAFFSIEPLLKSA